MESRIVTNDEMPQVIKLWETCFDDTMKFILWYFARYWKAENTLGIFDSKNGIEQLQASAQVIPYTIRLRDTSVPCGYIVGVDTAPEARNKGYAKQLLQDCLRMQREHNQGISLLMPFEGQFYYRYGWSFCYFHQRIITDPKELRCAAKEWGAVRKVDLYEAQETLQRVYRTFAQNYHGMVERTEQQWRLQLEDAKMENTICFLIEDENQIVQGYFLWTPLKEKCYVREIAWCNERAKQGMLYYLMQNVAENNKLWLELPEEDPIKFQIAATKTDIVLYPFLMARIVDVKQCLESLYYPMAQAEFILDVQDSFTDWNTGYYHIVISNHTARVNALTKLACQNLIQDDILMGTISIDALTQLVMGVRSVDALLQQEQLHCAETMKQPLIALLRQIWPVQQNYINEYY